MFLPWTTHMLDATCQCVVARVQWPPYMIVMYVDGVGSLSRAMGTVGLMSLKPLWEADRSAHVLLFHSMYQCGEMRDGGRVMSGSR